MVAETTGASCSTSSASLLIGGQLALLLALEEKSPRRRCAIEGARGLGRLLAQQLVEAGETAIDAPPALSARVRLFSGGSAQCRRCR